MRNLIHNSRFASRLDNPQIDFNQGSYQNFSGAFTSGWFGKGFDRYSTTSVGTWPIRVGIVLKPYGYIFQNMFTNQDIRTDEMFFRINIISLNGEIPNNVRVHITLDSGTFTVDSFKLHKIDNTKNSYCLSGSVELNLVDRIRTIHIMNEHTFDVIISKVCMNIVPVFDEDLEVHDLNRENDCRTELYRVHFSKGHHNASVINIHFGCPLVTTPNMKLIHKLSATPLPIADMILRPDNTGAIISINPCNLNENADYQFFFSVE